MIETTVNVALMFVGLSLLPALYRILRGPTVADRVAATDLLTSCIMAIVVLASVRADTRAFVDFVMAMAVLSFFGTVALARYLIGGRAID